MGRCRLGFRTCFFLVGFEGLLSKEGTKGKRRGEPPHPPRILQDRNPFTCPCILGEDGLSLDVTGTQLLEKDIENLARGEATDGK